MLYQIEKLLYVVEQPDGGIELRLSIGESIVYSRVVLHAVPDRKIIVCGRAARWWDRAKIEHRREV